MKWASKPAPKVGVAIVAALTVVSSVQAKNSPPPNVIVFIGDDISADDFGCYGHPNIHTPNVDALAADGLRFNNAYLTTSQCSPSRCSMITGRYPHNTGAPELHQALPADQVMFPKELRKAGYYTAAAGKWHLGRAARGAFARIDSSRPGGEEKWIQFLQERPKDKPFMMWFASHDAHRDWDPSSDSPPHVPADAVIPPYMVDTEGTRKDLAAYYDEVQRLDRYVGLVVEELKQQGVYENTLIFFLADNGRPFPRCKTWLYDSGIKPPFIVHWPHQLAKPGSACDALISSIDIAPTVLEAAGVAVPETVQGTSLMPLIQNTQSEIRDVVFAEHNWHDTEAHERMVRKGPWMYIRNARPERAGWVQVHHKYGSYEALLEGQAQGSLTPAQANVLQAPRPAEMLFNVEKDPHQLDNLADCPEHREILRAMRATLNEWQERTGDTTPADLTPDGVDRKTFKRLGKGIQPPRRGTKPGSECNASAINDPGHD